MKTSLELRDLYVGEVDAKHELMTGDDEGTERFRDSFLLPDNLFVEDFIDGKFCFITGLKGTGKTAFLRYISLQVNDKPCTHYNFFLFKEHMSEDDKINFGRSADAIIIDKSEDHKPQQDYDLVWSLFFHRFLVHAVLTYGYDLFIKDDIWKKYSHFVTAAHNASDKSKIWRLVPKLKKGNIELEIDPIKLGLEVEWQDEKAKTVTLAHAVRELDELFRRLSPSKDRLFIFIDELELSMGKKYLFERDVALIRDLITIIYKYNNLSREGKYKVKLIAAIRSEVLHAIASYGKEINKLIHDFGNNISWHHRAEDQTAHPLIKMIIRKLSSSEKNINPAINLSDVEIWNKYFPAQIQDMESIKYLLHNSWYRPRDFVRMLSLAKKQYPRETAFSQYVFDGTRKKYSGDSWDEMIEELSVAYSPDEINAINRLIYGFKPYFYRRELLARVGELGGDYKEIGTLLGGKNIGNILSDLFKVGVIGNSEKDHYRFAFRGDPDILLDDRIMVHRALWPHFSLSIR